MVGKATDTRPIAHAIGGAVGSALALLLLYPLERARIELQSSVSRQAGRSQQPTVPSSPPTPHHTNPSSSSSSSSYDCIVDDQDEEIKAIELDNNNNDSMDMGNVISNSSPSSSSSSSAFSATATSWNFVTETDGRQSTKNDNITEFSSNQESTQPTLSITELSNAKSNVIEEEKERAQEEISSPTSASKSLSKQALQQQQRKSLGLLVTLLRLQERGALYQGVSPVVSTVAVSQFIFFYLNEFMKRILIKKNEQKVGNKQGSLHSLLLLLASCLAGTANVLLTNPLWVTNMAIVTGKTKSLSLWKEFRVLVDRHGISYMWNGTFASLLLVSNPVIQFFCYEQLKQRRMELLGKTNTNNNNVISLSPLEGFLFGAIAKSIATILTYPLQLTQTVLRINEENQQKYKGTWDCLIKLYQHGGINSWYSGMETKLVQTVLTSAFTFLTYEQILGLVQRSLPPT